MRIRGALDAEGRCKHWHSPLDVVANKCATCGEYFACALCHAELTDHEFGPMLVDAPAQSIRDHHIATGDGRRNHGGKGSEQHGAFWGERGERGQRLSYVAQLGIEIILDE